MSAIPAISQAMPGLAAPLAGTGAEAAQAKAPFSDLLRDTMHSVEGLEQQARVTADGLMGGSGVDVHQAMIAAEKAQMGFELVLAVRNKAVAAYQQVMNMQF